MVAEKGFAEQEKDRKERCIFVGFRIDGDGRKLLGWALANIAKEGDCVMAVNVSPNHPEISRTPTLTLFRILNEFMADHEDLCTRKKIILGGRMARGNSVKRILVKEAEFCAAKTVVLGASKNFSFGCSASVAKYCAKKLPSTVSVIAVHKEQIIFERAANQLKPISVPIGVQGKQNLQSFLHPRIGMDTKLTAPTSARILSDERKKVAKKSMKESKDYCLISYDKMRKSSRNSVSALSRKLPEPKPGWPLLCKSVTSIEALKDSDERKMSVVQWVMNLPDRSFSSTKPQVDIITRLQHKHVVSLIGVCVEDNNPISVYSFFSRGSLEENLHGKRAKTPLDWDMRFKVAVGVAEALNYLHNGCPRPVIHRDVKSSNILLSDECEPMLSDFGLAIWGPTSSPYLTHGDVVGTFGYIAPEYFMYGKVSIKIDVYAFGVVLLELLTGRKPINDESPKGLESLVMWATPILERGDFMELLDPNLDGKYEENQMKRMVFAASLCIRRSARCRPHMNQILEILEGEQEIEPWMSSNVNNLTEQDCHDEEAYPSSSMGSHLDLALLDVDDDASVISFEQNHLNSLDEYLQDRWSHSSSFD
ncbi:hypothetical protein IEQ34_022820 [Dendrobium chrysotoxum]|uniref:Protein kinase domain-containing protein n=1 Tax=Dendrobium chrysotoxum TaxID=161865 RepID=A0AAV7FYJ7_DENCH|nr:hypothetical protein IEQ34_022820 [Dendrobium chrysotoxum]